MLQSNPPAPVVSIAEVRKIDVAFAGGKGAGLGELTSIGVPVPPGFVVTAPAYFQFLDSAGIRPQAGRLLSGLDVNDSAALERAAAELRGLISGAEMPADIAAETAAAYRAMSEGLVAVRSSATAEDLADASFAGQQDTYLNIEGAEEVVRAVQKCWASLFEARAIFYRAGAGFGQLDVGIAVVVQRMVQSERSGVMFTIHPVTNDRTQMVIEAIYGLGEAVVSGVVTPDMYVVEKASGTVIDSQVVAQEQELVRAQSTAGGERNHWNEVDWGRRAKQKLSEAEISELAAIGRRLEEHFGCPQDIEWAYDGSFYIVQARAVTTAG